MPYVVILNAVASHHISQFEHFQVMEKAYFERDSIILFMAVKETRGCSFYL